MRQSPHPFAAIIMVAAITTRAVPLRAQQAAAEQRSSAPTAPRGIAAIVIFPDSLPAMPRTMSELLAARAPGVVVQRSSGAAGAGAWISFRDAGAAMGAGPLVVVDGVRRVAIEAGSTTGNSRLGASTLDDIPVDEVERVELLRGPAAAARYGADARGGAIVVTTRAPRADGTRSFRAALTGGVVQNAASFPTNFAYLDANGAYCYFTTPCSTPTTWTPLNDYPLFRDGGRAALSADAAAALGPARVTLGATADHTRGVLPSDGTDRGAGNLRVTVPFGARSSLALASQAVFRGVALPRDDNRGVTYAGILGYAKDCTAASPCGPSYLSSFDSASHGYATARTPEELAADGTRERTRHYTQGLDFSSGIGAVGLHTRGGVDRYTLRGHDYLAPFTYTPPGFPASSPPPRPTSERTATRWDLEQQASVEQHGSAFEGSTLLALRVAKDQSKDVDQSYTRSSSISSNAQTYEVRAEQQARVRDRVDASLGLRGFRYRPWHSGREYPSRIDPYGSLALDIGDGVRLPGAGATTLRLRAAGGSVSSYERLIHDYFPLIIVVDPWGTIGPAQSFPPVAADRSTEVEGGFDLAAAAGSTRFSATLFRRADRFEELPLPAPQPSTGFTRLGTVRRATRGLELSLDARPIATPALTWSIASFVTFTKDVVASPAPPLYGDYPLTPFYTMANGAPLGDWRAEPLAWADSNGDGHLSYGEVSVAGPPSTAGRSRPSRVAGLTSSLSLGRSVTLGATLDYRGGHKVLDLARALQCQRSQCALLYDSHPDLARQAGAVMAASRGPLTGFLVPGDALRLNDVSLAVSPRWLAGVAHGARPRLTVAARDIRLWSRSHTLDDETVLPTPGIAGGRLDMPQPLTRSVEIRLDLAY